MQELSVTMHTRRNVKTTWQNLCQRECLMQYMFVSKNCQIKCHQISQVVCQVECQKKNNRIASFLNIKFGILLSNFCHILLDISILTFNLVCELAHVFRHSIWHYFLSFNMAFHLKKVLIFQLEDPLASLTFVLTHSIWRTCGIFSSIIN